MTDGTSDNPLLTASRRGAPVNYLDLLYASLFHPVSTFKLIGAHEQPGNRLLFYALMSVMLVSGSHLSTQGKTFLSVQPLTTMSFILAHLRRKGTTKSRSPFLGGICDIQEKPNIYPFVMFEDGSTIGTLIQPNIWKLDEALHDFDCLYRFTDRSGS